MDFFNIYGNSYRFYDMEDAMGDWNMKIAERTGTVKK